MTTPKKKRRNNRSAGHSFELTVRDWFRILGFPHLVTSRSESRSRDAQKVDLINQDEHVNGRFPYNVQCKNMCSHLKYKKVLGDIRAAPGVINVVIHKLTTNLLKAGTKGSVFVHSGTYAILDVKDFLAMVAKIKKLEELEKQSIPTLDRQPSLHAKDCAY